MASALVAVSRSSSPTSNQRQSIISNRSSAVSSSAASFRTAPLNSPSSPSLSSSRSSSAHTLNAADNINPMHTLGSSVQQNPHQEVHIVKVTGDTVHVEPGPIPDSFMKRVSNRVSGALPSINTEAARDVDGSDDPKGPPPPSPPASDEAGGDAADDKDVPDERALVSPPLSRPSHSEPTPKPIQPTSLASSSSMPSSRALVFDEPDVSRDRTTSTSTSTFRIVPVRASTTQISDVISRASTDTKSSLRTITNSRPAPAESTAEPPEPPVASSSASKPPSQNEYLQPPPMTTHHRPTRRNTTGSVTAPLPVRSGRASIHAQYGSQPQHGAYDDSAVDDDMENDIQMHAERIRRERMEKRAKQAEAEAALTRETSTAPRRGEDVPLVGNLIGEDHVNYVLMYNMLTGIRIGVSRCQAKIKRPLTDEDFTARHKFSFDIIGNELTPSAKYDFKFKDYAPWVFRSLREDHFHLDPADYLLSLTSKYILSELGSPGKSGSFFYFSRDYRFIIKTIHHREHKFLLRVLKRYYEHVKENPHTLISRFYGLHRVKLPRGRKIHFVIMNNLFPPHKDVHETYDLKGSTVGREFPEKDGDDNEKAQTQSQTSEKRKEKKKSNPVLKDLNWIHHDNRLEIGPEKRALLTEQLRRDKEMLKSINVMDYSLLVGIHNMQRGNKDNVRRKTLKVFDPDIPKDLRRHASQSIHSLPMSMSKSKSSVYTSTPEAIAMRRAMRESDPKRLGKGTIRLPEEDTKTGDRSNFWFYQDEGGFRATDENNENMDKIYYLGVIDILTPYSGMKKLEHCWKGLSADRHKISPVPPAEYADRFFAFMKAIMRGGGDVKEFV